VKATRNSAGRRLLMVLAAGIVLIGQHPTSAVANGYIFFSAITASKSNGTHFVGTVRDEVGKPMKAARVTLDIPGHNVTFVLWTDDQGRYHSQPIARSIDYKTVNLKVAKEGYRQIQASDRKRTDLGPAQAVEVDFVVRKAAAASSAPGAPNR
jgi:hypothetical protein